MASSRPVRLTLLTLLPLFLLGAGGRVDTTESEYLAVTSVWPGYGRGPAVSVAVAGEYAYVSIGYGGLLVLDVRKPAEPVRVGGYRPAGFTRQVEVSGSRAYLARTVRGGGGCKADARGCFDVLDVSDPAQPKLLGSYDTVQQILEFQVVSQRVYTVMNEGDMADGGGIEVLDVSDPAHIVGVSELGVRHATSLSVEGRRLGLASRETFWLGDSTLPLSDKWTAERKDLNSCHTLRIRGNRAFVLGGEEAWPGDGNVEVIDLASLIDPAPPYPYVGGVRLSSHPMEVQFAGDHAFVAAGESGLQVYDVSGTNVIKLVGSCALPGFTMDVAIRETCAYVAAYDGGFRIVDLADPAHPTAVGAYDTGLTARQIRVVDGRATLLSWDRHEHASLGRSRLELLDLSDSTRPRLLDTLDAEGVIREHDFNGRYACWVRQPRYDTEECLLEIAGGSDSSPASRLLRFPADLTLRRSSGARGLHGLVLVGDHAYVAGDDGVEIYGPSLPAQAQWVTRFGPGDANGVLVRSSHCFVYTPERFYVFDIHNPAKPIRLAQTSTDPWWYVDAFFLGPQHAYVSARDRLSIFSLEDLACPTLAATYPLVTDVLDGQIEAGRAYVARGVSGVEVLDLRSPAEPNVVASWTRCGSAQSVRVRNGEVFVADAGLGLVVLRCATDLAFLQADRGKTVPQGQSARLSVSATGPEPIGYQWYWGESGDLSNPIGGATNPQFTTPALSRETPLWVRIASGGHWLNSPTVRVAVVPELRLESLVNWTNSSPTRWVRLFAKSDGHPYLATDAGGFSVVDLIDPVHPQTVFRSDIGYPVFDLAISGSLAFLVGDRLEIFDVAQPATARRLSSTAVTNGTNGPFGRGLTVSGTRLWVRDSEGGLRSLDFADPSHPVWENVQPLVYTGPLALRGSYVYVAASCDGVVIYDVGQPGIPLRLGTYYAQGEVRDIQIQGDLAYLALGWNNEPSEWRAGDGGFEILDLSDPTHPVRLAKMFDGRDFRRVVRAGHYAFLLDSSNLEVVDIGNPSQPVLVGHSPLVDGSDLSVHGDLVCVAWGAPGAAFFRLVPVLRLNPPERIGGLLRLSWLPMPGIRLQRASDVASPQWQEVTVAENADYLDVSMDRPAFYRLVIP